jgi:hypothetical protein
VSSILWQGVSVELDAYRTFWVDSPTEHAFRCAIYDVSITVQDILGVKTPWARVRMMLPNGDVLEQSTDRTGKAIFTSVPRGRFYVSVTSMNITTSLDGDASINNDLTVVILLSNVTLIVSILIIATLICVAYLKMRRSRGRAKP